MNTIKNKIVISSVLFAVPSIAFAQVTLQTLASSVLDVMDAIIPALVAVALVFLLWMILRFVRAGDNDDERSKAKNGLVAGIVAFTLMFSLWGVINLLLGTFGFDGVDDKNPNVDVDEIIVDTGY